MGTDEGAEVVVASNAFTRPAVQLWAVLNVTPDSFSDGGRYLAPAAAVEHARALLREGADVIDVGGESSRPPGATYGEGAVQVSVEAELARVLPVVRELAGLGAVVSVDTTKAHVAAACLEAGAKIINDISGGASLELLQVVAGADCDLVLMHNRGRGERHGANVVYPEGVLPAVVNELRGARDRAVAQGIDRSRIWLDPGLGFAKTAQQSLALLRDLDAFVATGQRILVGASRKSFLADHARDAGGELPAPTDRESAHAVVLDRVLAAGCHAARVHDVRRSRQALLLAQALTQKVAS